MRAYWIKIAAGSLCIFVVGYSALYGFRRVKSTVESDSDLTIPIPFIPFQVDGTKLGTFRKLVLRRHDPHHLNRVDITVRLADAGSAARFADCSLSVEDPTHINDRTSFRCVKGDSLMSDFGTVQFQVKDEDGDWVTEASTPLVLERGVVARLRGEKVEQIVEQTTEANARMAEALGATMRQLGDSLGFLSRQLAAAKTDQEREAIRQRIEAVKARMREATEAQVVEPLGDPIPPRPPK